MKTLPSQIEKQECKLIIAGSRDFDISIEYLEKTLEDLDIHPTIIISGHSGNIDKLGEFYAHRHNLDCYIYIPDWEMYGNRAGPIRNTEMVKVADRAMFCWDGESRGTRDCIRKMIAAKKPYHICSPFTAKDLVYRVGIDCL